MGQSRENHADMIGIVLVKWSVEIFSELADMAASASYMHLEPGALIKIKAWVKYAYEVANEDRAQHC